LALTLWIVLSPPVILPEEKPCAWEVNFSPSGGCFLSSVNRTSRLEGVDTDGPEIQDYFDPFVFSSNACSFSRYPHVRNKKIENAGRRCSLKGPLSGCLWRRGYLPKRNIGRWWGWWIAR